MTQPLDRTCDLPALGDIDAENGEFWVGNAFAMPATRTNLSAYEQNRVYVNNDGRGFMDGSFASHANLDADSRQSIVADFDRDGAPDLLVGSVGGGPLRLFLNRFPRDVGRVRVELVGTESNIRGIGARVVASVGGQSIVRDVFSPNGCMGQSPPELHFGLGKADKIDALSIRWPNGTVQRVENVPANRVIRVVEGTDGFVQAPLAK